MRDAGAIIKAYYSEELDAAFLLLDEVTDASDDYECCRDVDVLVFITE